MDSSVAYSRRVSGYINASRQRLPAKSVTSSFNREPNLASACVSPGAFSLTAIFAAD